MSDPPSTEPLRQELLEVFKGRATRRYGLSAVSQLEHALQAAALAEADGAPPATVLASLLHDVGHMIHDLGENPAGRGIDDVHEERGAEWLAERFGPDVSEPVRLHVAAKRYLCAVEPDYFGKLSADSVRSLALQGGPMSADELDAFRSNPLHAEAVRLRRYDEAAKDPRASTPDFDHFLRHVPACRR
jgi:phosphonate degradation associated HDIG domain protein